MLIPERSKALAGILIVAGSRRDCTNTVANISGFSKPLALFTCTLAFTVRVLSSMTP